MKKHNFKKLLSCVLVVLMLSGAFAMIIPANAAEDTTIYLVPNQDNYVNGVKIRFETTGTDTYAKIENGKLVLNMIQGDMLWFPDLAIKDETTKLQFDIFCDEGDNITYIATGIQPKGEADYFYCQGYGSYGKWVCARTAWTESGNPVIKIDAKGDYWYKNDWTEEADGITTLPGSAIAKKDGTIVATTTFTMGDTTLRPVTSFQQSGVESPYVHTYAEKSGVDIYGSFGIVARNAKLVISLESVSALNITGNDGNYTEDFEVIESYSGPIINMRRAGTVVEFDSGIGFITFKYMIHENVTPDTYFVAKKNGVEVERLAISSFEPVEGVYTYETYFRTVEYTDILEVYLEKDGTVLPESTYEIDYGPQYKEFVENPPPVKSANLINVAYSEDFSTSIVLQPGENIVNGKKWTYIKNSTDGSAEIKSGRLYFKGSNHDMIIFEDLNVDMISYGMEYSLTYVNVPADDVWDGWDCWFGTVHHLGEADVLGNRFGYVASVTPNDVYMMQGYFAENGTFAREDLTDHAYFPNPPSSPTQPGELHYWNGRVGNGVPATVKAYGGVSGYDYGDLGISAYGVTGGHQVSANIPGDMTVDQRVGKLGFVCSESYVDVIIDNLVVKTPGKNVTVDGEIIQVPAEGEVNVSDLQADDKKLIYATVDGVVKYVGESFAATRLTEITTTQVAISTKKLAAVGTTGLKWTTEVNKADLDKILADDNVAKVEFGTVVVPTSAAKGGITVENAKYNIEGEIDAETGRFEGVLDIAKEDRDTSYSGIGYIKVTMVDGTEIVVYSDYAARNHAYALSDLVDDFGDEEEEEETEDDTTVDTEDDTTVDTEDDTTVDTEDDTTVDTENDTTVDTEDDTTVDTEDDTTVGTEDDTTVDAEDDTTVDTDADEDTDADTDTDVVEDTDTEASDETETETEIETDTDEESDSDDEGEDEELGFFGKIFAAIGNFFKGIFDWFFGLFA